MIKTLVTIMGISAFSSSSVPILKKYSEINLQNYNQNEIVDLGTIQLNKINLNIFQYFKKDNTINQENLFKIILSEEQKINQNNREKLILILKDFIKNQKDWSFIEFPTTYPMEGTSNDYPISVLYSGTGNFSGILSFDITLSNVDKTSKTDINDAFKNKNLKNLDDSGFKNKNEYIWQKIIELNPDSNVNLSDVEIIEINYNYSIIRANTNSSFKGIVKFTYNTIFNYKTSISATAEASSYSAIKRDENSEQTSIEFNLGKDIAQKNYSKITYKLTGNNWDNENDKNEFNYESDCGITDKDKTNYNLKSIDLSLEKDSVVLANRVYKKTNEMETWVILDWEWKNNTIEIKITAKAFAFAHWYNAYYAKASVNAILDNIEIV
ncbi:hypothetical protein [Spiroplasma endosymbiont of Crioceris asparagi]|uniref:hypothetical protein n=1 Tax=Spiroplasma endosymbiont of Crioceris asparagi TaxID=3066286 RepID=UPI0030CDE369